MKKRGSRRHVNGGGSETGSFSGWGEKKSNVKSRREADDNAGKGGGAKDGIITSLLNARLHKKYITSFCFCQRGFGLISFPH